MQDAGDHFALSDEVEGAFPEPGGPSSSDRIEPHLPVLIYLAHDEGVFILVSGHQREPIRLSTGEYHIDVVMRVALHVCIATAQLFAHDGVHLLLPTTGRVCEQDPVQKLSDLLSHTDTFPCKP